MTSRQTSEILILIVALFTLWGISMNVGASAKDGEDRTGNVVALVVIGSAVGFGLAKTMPKKNPWDK